jgi:hypothetical protein
VATDGYKSSFTGGTYDIASDGSVSLTVRAAGGSFSFVGAINDSKDFVGANTTSFVAAGSSDNKLPSAIYLIKSVGTFSNADLSGAAGVIDSYPTGGSDNGRLGFDVLAASTTTSATTPTGIPAPTPSPPRAP